jgi:hypothetical protein
MLKACVSLGQIVALEPHQAGFTFGQVETDAAPSRALTQAKSGPYAASSGLHLRSNRDRRHAPGVRLLRPNRGLTPHQADFIIGQIGTDATLQACAYSGQIGALRRIKRTSSSVKSGPAPRSRRALTQAKSGPPRRIKRTSSSVKSEPAPRSRRALTQAKSGPPRRIKRTSPSVTMISDGLGSGALNAVRAHAVTYPTEGHLEDYAPQGGSIASTTLRKHAQKEKIWARRVGGTVTYITRQKRDTRGRLVKNLTLRGSGREP